MTTATMEPPVVVVPVKVPTAPPAPHRGVLATFGDSVNRAATALRVQMAKLWAWIKLKARNGWTRVNRAWNWIKTKVTKMASWTRTKTKEVWTKVKKTVKGFWGWLKSKLRTVWEWVKEKTVKVWNWVCEKASTVWNWIQAKAPTVCNKVMSVAGWVGARFAQLGVAAKAGVMIAGSVIASVVLNPVVVVGAALVVGTMIIAGNSKGKAKPKQAKSERQRVTLPPELTIPMDIRKNELFQLMDAANRVGDLKLASEYLGREELIQYRLKYGFTDSAEAVANELIDEINAEEGQFAEVVKAIDIPSLTRGVKEESARWSKTNAAQAQPVAS